MIIDEPDRVLAFWFPDLSGADHARMVRQFEWWFRGGADAAIAERLAPLLERAVALADELAAAAPPEFRKVLEHSASQARGHRDVIARFGRQPHRNALLGRKSTPDELEYLARGELVHKRALPS